MREMHVAGGASAFRRRTIAALAVGIIGIGLVVIVGWLTDTTVLRRWTARSTTTRGNTALCIVLLGVVLLIQGTRWARARTVMGTVVALVALAMLVEHLTGIDLGLDQAVRSDPASDAGLTQPGRIPVATAAAVLALAVALMLVRSPRVRSVLIGQVLACVAFLSGLLSAVGYVYRVPEIENARHYLTGMAFPTAVAVLGLATGALLVRTDVGLVRPLATTDLIGSQSRRLLAVAIVVPFGSGWVQLTAQRHGLVGAELGLALFATANVTIFAALVWWNARSLGRAEQARLVVERALSVQQHQFQDFLDRAPSIMFAKDLEGRYLIANRAMGRSLRRPVEHIIGHQERDLVSEAEARSVRELDQSVIESGVAISEERSLIGRNGDVLIYHVLRFPLLDPSGRTYGLGGIAEDITDRKRAEVERAKFQEQLIEADRLQSLGQLAGGISHDFNNLLGVILNYATLLDRQLTDPQQRADVLAIRSTAERGAGLTRQLMAFTRQEQTQPEAIDVNELIATIIELLMRTLPSNVHVQSLLDPDVHSVVGDERQLERVVLNLALNAVDAMPDGGTFTIETTNTAFHTAPLEEPGLTAGEYVRLAISDTGVGMEDHVRRHAFEPFFTTKSNDGGTGLGLATVYGIISQAGGTVTIYSEPGTGTMVKIYLPAAQAPQGPVAPADEMMRERDNRRQRDGRRERLVVIEDEALLRQAIERTLLDDGFEVETFADAESALEHLVAARALPHVIVSDVVLPGMSGVDLALAVLGEHPEVQVLLISGYTANMLDGIQAGSRFDVLEKPFGPDALLSRVHALLSI